eukprot:11214692-Lingulodinium_polyedra.AAC.1
MLRMVLDCRPTNALHRRPPHTGLATPGALAEVQLGDAWVASCKEAEAAATGEPAPEPPPRGLSAFGAS